MASPSDGKTAIRSLLCFDNWAFAPNPHGERTKTANPLLPEGSHKRSCFEDFQP
jgi:hypothetical protein